MFEYFNNIVNFNQRGPLQPRNIYNICHFPIPANDAVKNLLFTTLFSKESKLFNTSFPFEKYQNIPKEDKELQQCIMVSPFSTGQPSQPSLQTYVSNILYIPGPLRNSYFKSHSDCLHIILSLIH